MRTHLSKTLASGVFFILIGAATFFIGRSYEFGSASQMGPGFFPVVVSSVLICLGAAITIIDLLRPKGESSFSVPNLAPVAWFVGGVALFGLTVRPLGLVAAIVLLCVLASLATRGRSIVEICIMTLTILAFSLFLFVYMLQMPIPLLPR